MDIHEDPEPDTAEKVTRFGCGTLLGVIVGIVLAIKLTLSSFGLIAAVIVGAVLVCGFLALRYGDEFWYAVLGSARWW
jgi:hypothetical protein